MDIDKIKSSIDAEISTRSSNKFGIKLGGELYEKFEKAGIIKMATFSAEGSGVLSETHPAYNGKYFVIRDFDLDDYAYEVGTPGS
jgi:hypothetical protein